MSIKGNRNDKNHINEATIGNFRNKVTDKDEEQRGTIN